MSKHPQPELLQKMLIKNLRSGKYKQTIDYLYEQDKSTGEFVYCCVGLAYELIEGDWTKDDVQVFHIVERRYGLNCNLISELNDDGKTFGELADMIEQGQLRYDPNESRIAAE